jgi:hypothetical protein
MNKVNIKSAQQKAPQTKLNATHEEFDFDLWAAQVRRQMMATLQKRGVR